MEVSDVHVGKQLQCNFSIQGVAPVPPLCFGFGAAAVPGTGFFNGAVLVGSPLNFPIPNVPSANLMVGRALPVSNPLAAVAPSIFKVSNLGSILPPTPIDVMIGDPGKGIVGLSCNTEIINIVNATVTNIVSPITNGVGIFNWTGSKTLVGVEAITGAKAQAGAEARSGGKVMNGSTVINGALVVNGATHINGFLSFSGSIVGTTKKFDIPHPTKKNYRLAHVCLEGPEAGVYYRGRLINNNVIELPDYWLGLVDPETITVNLTPHESYQELYVKSIEWGKKINILNNAGGAVNCSYVVYAERIDIEKLVVEYEGTEPKE
jgi:hypothetical protein